MISCPAFIRYIIKGILHFSHIQYYKTTYLSKNIRRRKMVNFIYLLVSIVTS